jgi:hypothetical protein
VTGDVVSWNLVVVLVALAFVCWAGYWLTRKR